MDCDLKPPLLAALDGKIEDAYTFGTQVEACFTMDGNPFVLSKLRFFK